MCKYLSTPVPTPPPPHIWYASCMNVSLNPTPTYLVCLVHERISQQPHYTKIISLKYIVCKYLQTLIYQCLFCNLSLVQEQSEHLGLGRDASIQCFYSVIFRLLNWALKKKFNWSEKFCCVSVALVGFKLSWSKSFVIAPTFDTKVTEYLCSGWVFFFFRQISTF